jgi:hypothetical protein
LTSFCFKLCKLELEKNIRIATVVLLKIVDYTSLWVTALAKPFVPKIAVSKGHGFIIAFFKQSVLVCKLFYNYVKKTWISYQNRQLYVNDCYKLVQKLSLKIFHKANQNFVFTS